MIKEFRLYPLEQCCSAWGDSLNRNTIRLTLNGYCLDGSEHAIRNCPYCGGDKQGRGFAPMSLTS